MSVLLQHSGPAGVQLLQDGLVCWQPGFDQSYGLPDIKHTHTSVLLANDQISPGDGTENKKHAKISVAFKN